MAQHVSSVFEWFWVFYPEVLCEHWLIVPPNSTQICQLVLIGRFQVTLNLLQRWLRPILWLTLIHRLRCQQVDPIITPFSGLEEKEKESVIIIKEGS